MVIHLNSKFLDSQVMFGKYQQTAKMQIFG